MRLATRALPDNHWASEKLNLAMNMFCEAAKPATISQPGALAIPSHLPSPLKETPLVAVDALHSSTRLTGPYVGQHLEHLLKAAPGGVVGVQWCMGGSLPGSALNKIAADLKVHASSKDVVRPLGRKVERQDVILQGTGPPAANDS